MENEVSEHLKRELVEKQPFFSQFTGEELDMLTTLFKEKHFKIDQTIVTEGDPVDSVYLIVKGKADVRHITMKDRVPQIESLATLGEGTSIGLSATGFYSLSGVRTATVVAITEVTTLSLSLAAFHGFKLAYPRINDLMRQATVTTNTGN
jgi:CRP-like cAMP-binding protein